MTRAAIYCRISSDREGAGLGVERQESDCRALADRLGWQVAEVFIDNDHSAYTGRVRPAYRAMLAALCAGTLDAVAAWHTDRLHRSATELEAYISVCEPRAIPTQCVAAGAIDLSSATGRCHARIGCAIARQEVEHSAERIRAQKRRAVQDGKPTNGARAYGYRQSPRSGEYRVVDEDEAQVIRDCAAHVLAGETITSIARQLSDDKVAGTRGSTTWTSLSVARILASARISGRAEHTPATAKRHRLNIGDITSVGCWPAIISVEDSDRLRKILDNPTRCGHHSTARKYLLSGILVCGFCGKNMVGQSSNRPHRTAHYRCVGTFQGARGGRHVTIGQEASDVFIRDLTIHILDTAAAGERLRHREAPPDNLHGRIRVAEQDLDLLAADLGNEVISRSEWLAARTPILARLAALRAQLAARGERDALEVFAGTETEMRGRWNAANLAQRRAVILAVFETIHVHPALTRGPKSFDIERFEPVLR